jgi:dihydrofolate synthase / folylpolyglutamate synthase
MPTSRSSTVAAYRAALDRLYRRRRFGLRPGLEAIRGVLDELGRPEASFRALHVAGSKGKGTVAALAASVLGASDGPAGLYTSPHLQSYRERIRIGGRPIAPGAVVERLAEVEAAAERWERRTGGRPPTFFEATTALAFAHFARHRVRHAAVEVGLGGEFDATNVVAAPVGVITTIELEHTDILGPTLTDVARAKAGILHPGMVGVVGEGKGEPLREIRRRADRLGVPLWRLGAEIELAERELDARGQSFTVRTPHRELRRIRIPFLGGFQARNAALAVAALERFAEARGTPLPEPAIREGFARARWRGRLERCEGRPTVYLDVAHTPESARALAEGLAEIAPFLDPEENVLLFGCLQGKRSEEMLATLASVARTVVVTPLRSDRSASPGELRRAAAGHFPRIIVAPNAAVALGVARHAAAPSGFVLGTGSDYLVGELLDAIEGRAPGEPDLSDPVAPAGEGAALPSEGVRAR